MKQEIRLPLSRSCFKEQTGARTNLQLGSPGVYLQLVASGSRGTASGDRTLAKQVWSTSFGVVDGFCATGAERGVVGVGAEVVAVTPTALAFLAGRGLDFDLPVCSRL
jgi:hypothetical protein